jgi:hypothetical protein
MIVLAGVTLHLMAKIRQQEQRPADALPYIQEAVAIWRTQSRRCIRFNNIFMRRYDEKRRNLAERTSQHEVFTVLIEQDKSGCYVATVPALKSCYTQARTLPELYARLQEVIELCSGR